MKKIKEKKQNTGTENTPGILFSLFLCGSIGYMQLFLCVPHIPFDITVHLLLALVINALLFAAYRFGKAYFIPSLILITAMTMAVILNSGTDIFGQLRRLQMFFRGELPEEMTDISAIFMALTCIMPCVIYLTELIFKMHFILSAITVCVLIFTPFLGININVETISLLFIFIISVGAVNTLLKKQKMMSQGYFFRDSSLRNILSVCLGAAVVLCAAIPLGIHGGEVLYNIVGDAEGFIERSMNTSSGSASDTVKGGYISKGNNYPTGASHLKLTLSSEPTENLYLRGFGGGEYTGGDWIRSSDEALFAAMSERGRQIGASFYYSMFFSMNEYMDLDEPAPSYTLFIEHSGGKYDNAYVPYYSERMSWSSFYNSYYSVYNGGFNILSDYSAPGSGGYSYRYYEQKDMHISRDNTPEGLDVFFDHFSEFQDEYIKQAKVFYTKVPTEKLPRLTALVNANPLSDLNDITEFILYTLHSRAKYSLTPGWSAVNRDIAEYFLFDRGAGFCEHFALAATLMYRLYGIPARYATGYLVQPNEFIKQDNGTYFADVTDRSAHAWAEIFIENYGWTPVEVTPASDGSAAVKYPGFNGLGIDFSKIKKPYVSFSDISISDGGANAAIPENSDFLISGVKIDTEKYFGFAVIFVSAAAFCVLMLPFYITERRNKILSRYKSAGCAENFARLINAVHFADMLKKYNGTEADFSEKLHDLLPDIPKSELLNLMSAVNRAAFGRTAPDAEEVRRVNETCEKVCAAVYKKLDKGKRFVFKYIKAFY